MLLPISVIKDRLWAISARLLRQSEATEQARLTKQELRRQRTPPRATTASTIKFDTFDEAYTQTTSTWQESDTLRFWDELANPVARSAASISRTDPGVVGTNTSAVTPGIFL